MRSDWSLCLHQLPADNSLSSTLWPLELRGASSICPTPDHTICLCPDCAHSWMHLAASSPIRVLRPAVPRELWLHVSSLANRAQVGAGHIMSLSKPASVAVASNVGSFATSRGTRGPSLFQPFASIVYLLLPVLLTSTQSSPQSSATCVGKELFSARLLCATAHASHEPTF